MVRRALLLLTVAQFFTAASTLPAIAAELPQVKTNFLAANPNNGWEYGFLEDDGSFIAYNTTFDDGQGIAGWALNNTPGPEGDVTINYTDQPIDRYGVHWEPGQICVHTALRGNGVVVRWTAPTGGSLQADAQLTSQSPYATAEVKALLNNIEFADTKIDGLADAAKATQSSIASASVSTKSMRSSTLSVRKNSRVEYIFLPDSERGPCHIGVIVNINSIDTQGASSAMSSLGAVCKSKTSEEKPAVVAKNGVQK